MTFFQQQPWIKSLEAFLYHFSFLILLLDSIIKIVYSYCIKANRISSVELSSMFIIRIIAIVTITVKSAVVAIFDIFISFIRTFLTFFLA